MNKIYIIGITLTGLFLQAQVVRGQMSDDRVLNYSLSDCIERGLANNYDLQISRNQAEVAHNNATLANAGALPSLDASASLRPSLTTLDRTEARSSGVVTTNRNVNDLSIDAGVSLSWTIFDGFKIQTNLKQLRLLEQQGETATRIAMEDLVADISTEYYNYIQQLIRSKHYNYAMNLSRERLRIAELNFQTGRFSGLDYHQAQVDYHSDSTAYVRQRESVSATCIRLNKLMGNKNLSQQIVVPDSMIKVMRNLNVDDLWNRTLASNTDLLYASQNMTLAEQDLKKVTSRNYPYVRLNAQYGYTHTNYDISATRVRDNLGLTGGLSVGINIFDGNRRRERKNAELAIQNRKLQREKLELELHASLMTFWDAYENNLELIELQKKNLGIAENNLEIAMDKYKLGNLSGFDMRQVEKNLLDAKERLLQVEYEAKLCEISLMLISGSIYNYLE